MAAYPDDFNRADGEIGSGWTVYDGSMDIVSHHAHADTPAWAYATGQSETGDQDHYVVVPIVDSAVKSARVVLKKASGSDNCYWAMVSMSGANLRVSVGYVYDTTDLMINYTDISVPAAASLVLRGTYDSSGTKAYVDGTQRATQNYTDYASQGQFGFALSENDAIIDAFDDEGGEDASIAVTPDPLWVGAGPTIMTMTGTGTTWTPGVPGSSTVSADHGTVSDQWTSSATEITFTFTPAEYIGVITFTESEGDLTAEIDAVAIKPEGYPETSCLLTPEGADIINDTGANYPSYDLLTQGQVIVPAADQMPAINVIQALSDVWYIITGGGGRTPPEGNDWLLGQLLIALMGDDTPTVQLYTAARATSIREELEALTDNLNDTRTVNDWTLGSVINEVRGTSNRTVTEVYDLVDALESGSNADVLAWLDLYLGTTGPTLAQLGTMISDLATIAGYTLGDVLDAIAAIPGTDLTAITNKLNAIQPSTDYSLTTIDSDVANLDGDVAAVKAVVDAIKLLVDALPTEQTNQGPPVWPGAGNVTLGTPVALVDQLVLTGAMDGVLVDVTTPPTKTGRYNIGGETFDYGVGHIAFVTDNGYIEPWQYLGFRTAIYTPKTMQQASGALFRVLAGAGGTTRTWIRS